VVPRAPGARGGNRVTALRWAARFRQLGFAVFLENDRTERPCDCLVALHGEKSFPAIGRAREASPALPIVLALAGTDLYGDGKPSPKTLEAIELATHLVVLQPRALEILPPPAAQRASVIYQSVTTTGTPRSSPLEDAFEVCVLAHLRAVKDPLLPARAARSLSASSRVLVRLIGGALDEGLGLEARREARENPRFAWEGALPRASALRLLRRARVLVSPSRHEGGSNAVSEALAFGVPVLATAIPGTLGLLGDDYPGTFPVGDEGALAHLLEWFEEDDTFQEELRQRGRERAWITAPELERRSWGALLEDLLDHI